MDSELHPMAVMLTCWLDWFPNGRGAVGYLPFYVWAAGVGLFHGASYLEDGIGDDHNFRSP